MRAIFITLVFSMIALASRANVEQSHLDLLSKQFCAMAQAYAVTESYTKDPETRTYTQGASAACLQAITICRASVSTEQLLDTLLRVKKTQELYDITFALTNRLEIRPYFTGQVDATETMLSLVRSINSAIEVGAGPTQPTASQAANDSAGRDMGQANSRDGRPLAHLLKR